MDPIEQGSVAHIALVTTDAIEDSADGLLLLRHAGKEGIGVADDRVELR